MEWRPLPPVDWWILTGGVLWSIFWMTVVYLLISAVAHMRLRLAVRVAHPLTLEHGHARKQISRERFDDVRRDLPNTSSPHR
jgi:hypothetical protein